MKWVRRFLISSLLLAGIGGLIVLGWILWDLPSVDSLPDLLVSASIKVTDRNGRLLYEVLDEEGGRNAVVALESIPRVLQQATIATEDRNYYQNFGVDVQGILRALWINLRGGEVLAGGSTITQQVARNLLLDADERLQRTVRRKLRESLLAWRLSKKLSKEDILSLYLNQMYYGAWSYGVEAAAQTYFAKKVAELDLAECALLAGIPQAPAIYNPFVNIEATKERQLVVLGLMAKEGMITPEEREQAAREPLIFASTPFPIEAPHFVMMVRSQLDDLFPQEMRSRYGALIVRTTLDLDWQHQAERAVKQQLMSLSDRSDSGLGHNVNNAAMVVLDTRTGETLALVGSPDYFEAEIGGAINMSLAPRQPGSAIKPIIYAAAFDPHRPQVWTPATMILDVTTTFSTHEGLAYTPANYDNLEHGPVLVREALASSLNIPAVKTLDHVGMEDFVNLAVNLGITTIGDPLIYDLSMALGGGEVSLLDLTAAYAAFSNGGYRISPFNIMGITTVDGEILYTSEPTPLIRVLDERVAWLISDILSDNDARTPGFGHNSVLRLDRPAAVKTGTTTNFYDNWTVGYTPGGIDGSTRGLVVGVWVGNSNHEPMRGVTGLSGAAPIWHQFVRSVLTGVPKAYFERPAGIECVEVCALSGLLPTDECPYRRTEWFISGTEPSTYDTFYKQVMIDGATGFLADENTPLIRRKNLTVLDLPPQAYPWAKSQGLKLFAEIQPTASLEVEPQISHSMQPLYIISPGANTVYRIDSNISQGAQRIHIQAAGDAGLKEVTLWVDGELIAALVAPPYEAWWSLKEGEHQIWAQGITFNGEKVESDKVSIEVK